MSDYEPIGIKPGLVWMAVLIFGVQLCAQECPPGWIRARDGNRSYCKMPEPQTARAGNAATVPPPGLVQMQYDQNGISFLYPTNWTLETSPGGEATIAPPEARSRLPNGTQFTTHGLFVGYFQNPTATDLDSATDALIAALRSNNPSLTKVAGAERPVRVDGRDAREVPYTNYSTLSPEVGLLITVAEPHGIWFWLMFAPSNDYDSYKATFANIVTSIRLEQEARSEADEHAGSAEIINRIVHRLRANRYSVPAFRVVVTNQDAINAYARPDYRLVVLPIAMVHFLQDNEGELAFVVAHELGHLQDNQCSTIAQSVRITKEGQSRFCEQRADEIGLQYLIGAGYNPYDAGGLLGRLMMFYGRTGLLEGLLNRFLSDHPIDNDRIGNLRKLMIQLCSQPGSSCQIPH